MKSPHDLIPGGAHTYSKGDDQFPANAPRFLERGEGAYVWDENGTQYLDWTMGLRTVTLGYGYRPVLDAVAKQMWRGSNFGRPSRIEMETAEDLLSLLPHADMVKFAKNGSNVTTAAVKLARAYTGRDAVAICSDHPFFSFDDWFIGSTPCDSGIPQAGREHVVGFRYNDLAGVEQVFATRGHELACLIMEAATVDQPKDGFLHAVRALCRKHDVIFVLDEMITGFRWHNGGAQAYFNLDPDLSTFGKAMGNGFATAAVVGKRDIMRLGGIDHDKPRVFLLSATHGAENHSLAATRAVIEAYRNEPIVDNIWSAGQSLMLGLNNLAHKFGIESAFRVVGFPCSPYFICGDSNGVACPRFRTLFLQEMINRNVIINYIAPSFSHKSIEVEKTLDAAEHALGVYSAALHDGCERFISGPSIKPVFRRHN